MDHPVLIIVAVVVNPPLFFVVGWAIFKDWEDVWESIKYWVMPDWLSMLRGEYFEDLWSELKLFYFAAVCGALVFMECLLYQKFFGT